MKLHSAEFEQKLKTAWAASVRALPESKRRFVRTTRWHERQSLWPFLRPLFSAVLGYAVFAMAQQSGHLASSLAVVTLTGFLFACAKAATLREKLYSAPDLPMLGLLPTADDTVFKWQFQKYVKESAGSVLDFAVAYGVIVFYYQLPASGWVLAMVVAFLNWALVTALSIIGATYLARAPYWIAGVVLIALPLGILYNESFRTFFIGFVDRQAVWLNALLPTGYAVWLFDLLVAPHEWLHLAMLAPAITVLWIGKIALAQLRRSYRVPAVDLEEARCMDPDEELAEKAEYELPTEVPSSPSPNEIEDFIIARTFLAPQKYESCGLFECLLWKWFTPRERALAEFAFPNGIEIQDPWVVALKFFACTCLAWAALGLLFPTLALWLLGIGLFVTVCVAIGQTGGGRAFDGAQVSGAWLARHSLYPIGYHELGHMLFKHAAVQIPMLMAYAVAASALLGHVAHWPMGSTLLFGVKAGGALFAGTFVVATFGFSGNTTDTVLRWRNAGFLSAVLLCIVTAVAFGLAAFLSKNPAIAWPCWALMIANAYIVFRVYGWFHDRNTFDAVRAARS